MNQLCGKVRVPERKAVLGEMERGRSVNARRFVPGMCGCVPYC